MRSQFKKSKRIVIKIGSSVLTGAKGQLDTDLIAKIVDQISALIKSGKEVVLVSSGAIASGMSELGFKCRPSKLSCLQASAAIGQSLLMQTYNNLFKKKNLRCAQVLLTWDDFHVRSRYLNAKETMIALLDYKAIPIINENDTVSTEEIRRGDNDHLSALVASLLEADLLILLSDVDGLFSGKQLVSEVKNIDSDIRKLAKDTKKRHISRGGMLSKLDAVDIASHAGITSVIANGKANGIILKIIDGEKVGTLISLKADRMVAKKRWMAFGVKSNGKIFVDDGAKKALVEKNKSLLCPGVIRVEGNFDSGDVVSVVDKDGNEIAKGKVNFSYEEVNNIKGKKAT
ncbi:MAG: glutamate 5-kinase, partial [Candidatus Omnitrophica bacterium]|nr:glutamate 5-kinase [Candidatus Omnitrophota bacterium]